MGKFRYTCGRINLHLIIALILSIPVSTALGSIFSMLILIFFLLHANFKEQFNQLKNNKVVSAFILYVALHILALIWTQDMEWGVRVVKKQWKFLLIPIFMIYVKKEYLNYYIYSFVISILLSCFFSYLIWFEFIEPFGVSTVQNPTPFMSHITYNPLLSFAAYLIGVKFILNKNYSFLIKNIHIISFIFMTINMFITGGRTGQIMFFLVIIILCFHTFRYSFYKSLFSSILVSSLIFFAAYNSSDLFKTRTDEGIYSIKNFNLSGSDTYGKSTMQRVVWVINGIHIFAENPIIGVGTGDLRREMWLAHQELSPEVKSTDNPHNMYVMVLVQFGIIGFISLLYIFYTQIKFSITNKDALLEKLGFTLPVLFIVANLAESYLSVHTTSLFYSIFSAIIYCNYDKRLIIN